MTELILDASSILALLNSETGAEIVQQALPEAKISTVNLAEVVTRLTLIGMSSAEIEQVLNLLGLESVAFDEEQALQAGIMATLTQGFGLSLGDRACLALGVLTNTPVLTADRAWQNVSLPVEIKLIR
ncbi:MAG: type II toxin-antitoxin system VapC family toxin [Anaerolineaceae bacterium]|nr:type II toxin-antitoxin system VapC family toxin [Anaerolineaceae bacterium]